MTLSESGKHGDKPFTAADMPLLLSQREVDEFFEPFRSFVDICKYLPVKGSLPHPLMQNRVEGDVDGNEDAMLQPRLRGQNTVPWIAMIPVEGGRQFGMQIGHGDCLQAAVGHGRTELLGFQIELFQPHLIVQLVEGHCANEDCVRLVLDQ